MSWKAYNALMDDPRLLVLDSRSLRAYLERHLRGSVCVRVTSNGKSLEYLAGPGPPIWSQDCWWGRRILVVSPRYSRESQMLKAFHLDGNDDDRSSKRSRKSREDRTGQNVDEVIKFLISEGRVKSLKIVETNSGEDTDAYTAFAKQYPFLVTKSQKAAVVSGYPAEIVPKVLYLGDMEHAKAEKNLGDLQITHVLTIHTEPQKLAKRFVQLFCELADESKADITQFFESMYQFVEDARKANKRVLVHCGAGASRSATLCAAYLMRVNHWKAEIALKFLKDQRRQVDPNAGFTASLYQYEKVLGLSPTEDPVSEQIDVNQQPEFNPTIEDSSPPLIFEVLKEGTLLGTLAFSKSKPLTCGRAPTCDIVLDHTSISRQHAKLEYAGEFGASILDLGSIHGTFVNNARLTPSTRQQLHVGDVVIFGASTRRYVVRPQ